MRRIFSLLSAPQPRLGVSLVAGVAEVEEEEVVEEEEGNKKICLVKRPAKN